MDASLAWHKNHRGNRTFAYIDKQNVRFGRDVHMHVLNYCQGKETYVYPVAYTTV